MSERGEGHPYAWPGFDTATAWHTQPPTGRFRYGHCVAYSTNDRPGLNRRNQHLTLPAKPGYYWKLVRKEARLFSLAKTTKQAAAGASVLQGQHSLRE